MDQEGVNYFLDTNVLVYSVDDRDLAKQDRAREVMERLVALGKGALSSQVLVEFANVALSKLGYSPEQAQREVERCELVYSVFPLTAEVVLGALRAVTEYKFSYYDAQIWAAAKQFEIEIVLSEDFQAGSTFEDVRFENPFDEAFEPSWLG